MRILIIGAGPAGLSFAALMADEDPRHEITLIEKNAAHERPGFGITLRSDGISLLGLDSMDIFQHLQGRAFRYRGDLIVDLPNPPSAHLVTLSRAALLTALTDRCSRSGVRVRFETDAARLRRSDLDQFDLVIAADGAHSAVRRLYESAFAPVVKLSRNRYGWFGANTPIHKLTIMLNDTRPVLLAWGYKHTESLSTLIVESSATTIQEFGLDGISPSETARIIANSLSGDLSGASVICGTNVQWMSFPRVSCAKLRHRNIVLIGDAAHTTHFSQGFGTMFAFDDSITLRSALAAAGNVGQALELYEEMQLPKIAEFQEISDRSMEWSETLMETAGRGDVRNVRELIRARWTNNHAPPCPGAKSPPSFTPAQPRSRLSPGSHL